MLLLFLVMSVNLDGREMERSRGEMDPGWGNFRKFSGTQRWKSANWLLLQNAESAMCYLLTRESVKWLVSSWPRRDRRMRLLCDWCSDCICINTSGESLLAKKQQLFFCCFNFNSSHLPTCNEAININVSPLRIVFLSPLFTMKWVFFPFHIRDVSYVNQWGLAVQQCFDLESEMTEKPDSI